MPVIRRTGNGRRRGGGAAGSKCGQTRASARRNVPAARLRGGRTRPPPGGSAARPALADGRDRHYRLDRGPPARQHRALQRRLALAAARPALAVLAGRGGRRHRLLRVRGPGPVRPGAQGVAGRAERQRRGAHRRGGGDHRLDYLAGTGRRRRTRGDPRQKPLVFRDRSRVRGVPGRQRPRPAIALVAALRGLDSRPAAHRARHRRAHALRRRDRAVRRADDRLAGALAAARGVGPSRHRRADGLAGGPRRQAEFPGPARPPGSGPDGGHPRRRHPRRRAPRGPRYPRIGGRATAVVPGPAAAGRRGASRAQLPGPASAAGAGQHAGPEGWRAEPFRAAPGGDAERDAYARGSQAPG